MYDEICLFHFKSEVNFLWCKIDYEQLKKSYFVSTSVGCCWIYLNMIHVPCKTTEGDQHGDEIRQMLVASSQSQEHA